MSIMVHILFIFLFSFSYNDCPEYKSCETCTKEYDCIWCDTTSRCQNKMTFCEKPKEYLQSCTDETFAQCQYYQTCLNCVSDLNCVFVRGRMDVRYINGSKPAYNFYLTNGTCWKGIPFTGYPTTNEYTHGDRLFKISQTASYYLQCSMAEVYMYVIIIACLLIMCFCVTLNFILVMVCFCCQCCDCAKKMSINNGYEKL